MNKLYNVYFTHSLESITEDAVLIARRSTYKGCWQAIDEKLKENEIEREHYTRYLLDTNKDTLFIDYGSWSTFAAISPIPPEVFS
jgi:hypothetical protein